MIGVSEVAEPDVDEAEVVARPTNPRITLGSARVVLEAPGSARVTVPVQVAATAALRRRGLMYRHTMPRGTGMLFVFDEPDVQTFWMRNTYLRLDLIFIGPDLSVVGIVENAAPLTDETRAVDARSQYVLEVHGGFAAEHGVVPGSTVHFEGLSEE